MNKISKKILAIVTMAAFVVTMMPFAAFAAPAPNTNDYEASLSYVTTDKQDVSVDVTDPVDVNFEINDKDGNAVTKYDNKTATTYFWVTDASNNVVRTATFYDGNGTKIEAGDARLETIDQGTVLIPTNVFDGQSVKVSFSQPGTYTIHAGVDYTNPSQVVTDLSDLSMLQTEEGYNTIEVTAESAEIDGITVDGQNGVTVKDNGEGNFTVNEKIKPNSTATQRLTVTAKDGSAAAKNENFTIDTSSSNINVTAKDMRGNDFEAGTATTDRNGQFQLVYTVAKAGEYKIYLESEDGYEAVINVTSDDINVYPADIVATEDNAKVLNKDTLNAEATAYLSDAVQFQITDNNGTVLEGADAIKDEPATTGAADYVKLLDKPEKFDADNASKFALAWDENEDVYTLSYTGKNLIDGEYTVRVALEETGEYADVTFTVDTYGKTQSIKIDTDEEVVLGQPVTGKVVEVDENGLEKPMKNTDYSLSITGKALTDGNVAWSEENTKFSRDTIADRFNLLDIAGTQISIIAVSEKYGMATADVTAVAQASTASLSFDSTNGVADKNNTVNVSVVDEDGNVMDKVSGKVYAYVADQSNEDAKVEVDVVNSDDKASKGKARISIYSNLETTVDVVVAIQANDNDGSAIYADTLEYTIGEADVNADTIVAMTIGSSDIIVNNDIVSGDAAPFVDSNWRTMVPVRALSEAFGGSAEWDGDARTVTVVNGDTTIVFNADSDKYTVNGEEKTMDTELTIVDGRTYVPVRFVADELGYKITVLKDAQGLTAGVVFQK